MGERTDAKASYHIPFNIPTKVNPNYKGKNIFTIFTALYLYTYIYFTCEYQN